MASQAPRTAACLLEWRSQGVRLSALELNVTDGRIFELRKHSDGIAIDAPFGWPDAFVATIIGFHVAEFEPIAPWTPTRRDDLRFRLTDLVVHRQMGRPPLSVSTDRIALPALRCASLLGAMGVRRRTGDPGVVEAYPAAALHAWDLGGRGYKAAEASLAALAATLLVRVPRLEATPEQRAALSSVTDLFDAFVTALVSRASLLGGVTTPPPEHSDRAAREGWIAVPTVGPEALA